MAFYHGVRTSEVETSLISPVQTENNLPFIVGTSRYGKVLEPVLAYQYKEFVAEFGETFDFDNYTLNEAAYCEFALFNQSPAVFVNVLDPEKHYNAIEFEVGGITNTPCTIEGAVIDDTVEITSSGTSVVTLDGATQYTETADPITSDVTIAFVVDATLPPGDITVTYDVDTDTTITVTVPQSSFPYTIPSPCSNVVLTADMPFTNTLIKDTDYSRVMSVDKYIITIIDDSKIVNDAVTIKYHELDASQVTADDINAGFDVIEDVFPKYGLVASILVAPKYSTINSVIAVMKAKTSNVNSVWRSIALCDIPTDTVTKYTDAVEYKNQNNLVDANLVVCWPKVAIDGRQYHMSTQLMGLMQTTAADRDDLPYKSPSNENLQCDSLVLANGKELYISFTTANYLNSQGIYTGLNFIGGFKGFGNRTAQFPSSTDPREVYIAVRRMFNYVNNQLILTYWQKVDDPMNSNLIESCVDSLNIWMNGLVAAGALLAGRVEIHDDENPTTDLLNGIIKFHLYISPPIPCEQLEFILEYDTTALQNLFSASA